MTIETAQDAIDTYKSFDDWKYADREAAWKWMFEAGKKAEREACAMEAERGDRKLSKIGKAIAASIRRRGEKK